MRDPRATRRYRTARALWLAGYKGGTAPCVLCGGMVLTSLPGTHPYGPTIEHQPPVRALIAMAKDYAHAVAMVSDTSTFAGVAHKRCQDRQGGASSVERPRYAPSSSSLGCSRDW